MGNEKSVASIDILKRRKCTAFAGICTLMMLSCTIAAMAAMTRADTEFELAEGENAKQWRALDVFALPPADYWGWHVRKPVALESTGFEIPFNDVAGGEFTVYLRNTWVGDLSGMMITATISIEQDSEDKPVFVTRTLEKEAYVRLGFQTTSGSWDTFTYWWSYACIKLDDLVGNTLTLSVPLNDGALWQCINGGWTGNAYPDEFAASLADVQEIGFTFGWLGSWASGTALEQGAATFIVDSYSISPTE